MKHVFVLLTLCLTPFFAGAELLQNGNFEDETEYWRVMRHGGYGSQTTASVSHGELHLGDLVSLSTHYLSVSQPVLIEEGKKYRFTFEVKGKAGNKISLYVGDAGAREISAKRAVLDGSDWNQVEFVFTAKCSTDPKWFKKAQKFNSKNELGKKGMTKTDAKTQKKYKSLKEDAGYTCQAAIAVGAAEDHVVLRKVSLVAVDGTE